MQTIRKLPNHLIARIAAGEVIERPAFVVKELVENALDAAADSIRIELDQGGLSKIIIVDNGKGMSSEDVLVCSDLHTTNKISENDTLSAIKSLGFRGEALASIAAVSRFTIKSRRRPDSAGTAVRKEYGKEVDTGTVGMPPGTVVIAEELFGTMPGRKKFLKSQRTELRHVLETVTEFALSYPEVRIVLTHNGKTLLDLPPSATSLERIREVAGKGSEEQSIPVLFSDSYLTIEGYTSHPQLAYAGTEKLHIFVNRRAVRDKQITSAIKEAYGNLLEPSSYPFAVLSLTAPFEFVDVNVHPRKELVAFTDGRFIFSTVVKAVTKALKSRNLAFYTIQPETGNGSERYPTSSLAGKLLKEVVEPWNTHFVGQREPDGEVIQVHNTYLVAPTRQGVLVVDVHALHEKLLYERFKEEFLKRRKKPQSVLLPKPQPIPIQISDLPVLEEYKASLKRMGFRLRKNKGRYLLESVPELLKDRDCFRILIDILEDYKNDRPPRVIDTVSEQMLAYLACRTAFKAGQALTREQIRELVAEMDSHPEIVTCPHGRPVKLELSLDQLHKLFRRI